MDLKPISKSGQTAFAEGIRYLHGKTGKAAAIELHS